MSDEITRLREQVLNLQKELQAERYHSRSLQARLDGDIPKACRYLQMRGDRQRVVLDLLNRKVLSQRFRLRTISLMGRDLTKEEYLAAKEKLENSDRILDYEPVTV